MALGKLFNLPEPLGFRVLNVMMSASVNGWLGYLSRKETELQAVPLHLGGKSDLLG